MVVTPIFTFLFETMNNTHSFLNSEQYLQESRHSRLWDQQFFRETACSFQRNMRRVDSHGRGRCM